MSDLGELPRLYTIDDLRQWLGLESARHLERNVSSWPHLVIARQVRFTAEHMAAIVALHERGSTAADAPAFTGQRTRGGTR